MRVKGSYICGTKMSRKEERNKDDFRKNSNSLISSELWQWNKNYKNYHHSEHLCVTRKTSITVLQMRKLDLREVQGLAHLT